MPSASCTLPMSRDLSEALFSNVAVQPDSPAFAAIDTMGVPGRQLCWRDMGRHVAAAAAQLTAQLPAGARVLVPQGPALCFAVALLGCLAAGVVAVPVPHPVHRRRRSAIEAIATDCGASAMLVPGEGVEGAEGLGVGVIPMVAPEREVPFPAARFAAGDLALLQYTSGSTGQPKGVMLTRGNLAANAAAIAGALAVTSDARFLTWLPLFHDMGLVTGVLVPVLCGVPSLFLPTQSVSRDPLRWLEAISAHRITHSGGPNFALASCVERADPARLHHLDLSCWRSAFLGAEPIFEETLRRFADETAIAGFAPEAFQPCYGLAETTLMATAATAGRGATVRAFARDALRQGIARAPAAGEVARALTGCGMPPPQARIAIRDDKGDPVAPGVLGEVLLSGPSVGAGYWQKPEATAATFVSDAEGAIWLRTGDIGFLDGGELFIAGRIKDRLILRGRTQHPHDIERAASLAHPDLLPDDAIAFPVEAMAGEGYAVVCALRRGAMRQWSGAELVLAIRRACVRAAQADPEAVALVGPTTLPRTSSGKPKRRTCAEAFAAGTLETLHVWRRSAGTAWNAVLPARPDADALAGWIAGWIACRLRVPAADVSLDLPFEEVGLDSIGSVELVVALEQALERDIPETMIWDCRTIGGLAAALARPAEAAPAARAPAYAPAPRPTSDLLARLRAELSGTLT